MRSTVLRSLTLPVLPVFMLADLPVPDTAAAPVITGTAPAANSLGATTTAEVTVSFATPVDPGSVNTETFSVFGRWSGVRTGRVRVDENGRRARFVPDQPFMPGEQVTVSVTRGVRGTEGTRLERGYAWVFWVAAGRGTLDLTSNGRRPVRREGEGLVQTYGAYAGDFDGDGYSDLAVPNERANDVRVFLNDGTGDYRDFTILAIPDGAVPSPNEGADFNRDGIIDFAVGNAGNNLVSVFIGTGGGRFRHDANYAADRGVRGVCLLDLDGDGYTDIATANMRGGRRGNVTVMRNDGTGRFDESRDVPGEGRGEKTCAVADFNEDGVMDLAVGAYASRQVLLFLGDGEGGLRFTRSVDAGGSPWMIVAGDVTGDGHVDVVAANRTQHNVAVIAGNGAGGLAAPVPFTTGREPMAVDVGDLDGDGDLDVVSSNLVGKSFTLYENAGDGTLINPRTLAASAAGSCAIIHDRDNDGDLDLTGVDELDDYLFLFENRP